MKRQFASIVLASLFTTPVFAQSHTGTSNEGPYLGAAIGHAKLDNSTLDWLEELGADTDNTDTAYKLFLGYQFNPNFAVETSYVNLGDYTASAVGADIGADLKLGLEGFGFALVGTLPIQGGLSVYGKLGMFLWDGDVHFNAVIDGSAYRASAGEDGVDPFYGIGVEYVVNQIMLRAEFERYDISDSGEDFTVDLLSASIGYRF